MAQTFALIIAALIMCWTPQLTIYFVVGHTKDEDFFQRTSFLRAFHVFAILTAQLNSAINPFIYAYRIKEVRDQIKETLGLKKKESRVSSNDVLSCQT